MPSRSSPLAVRLCVRRSSRCLFYTRINSPTSSRLTGPYHSPPSGLRQESGGLLSRGTRGWAGLPLYGLDLPPVQAGDRPPPLEITFSMMAKSGYPPEDFVMAPQGGDRPPSPLDDSRGGGGSMRVSSPPPRDLRCLAQGMGCLFTPPGPGVLIAAGQRIRLPI